MCMGYTQWDESTHGTLCVYRCTQWDASTDVYDMYTQLDGSTHRTVCTDKGPQHPCTD